MCSTYMRPFLPRVDPSRIQLTSMFMCNTCMRPFLPRADPTRIQLNSTMQASHPLSRSAPLLSFLQRKRIQSDHSEHVQTRVNLELASGWQTNYQLFSLLHKLPGIDKIYRPWTPSKGQETDPFHSTQKRTSENAPAILVLLIDTAVLLLAVSQHAESIWGPQGRNGWNLFATIRSGWKRS